MEQFVIFLGFIIMCLSFMLAVLIGNTFLWGCLIGGCIMLFGGFFDEQ